MITSSSASLIFKAVLSGIETTREEIIGVGANDTTFPTLNAAAIAKQVNWTMLVD
jgi:hypothetical protein